MSTDRVLGRLARTGVLLAVVAPALMLPHAPQAATQAYVVDPEHTAVTFSIRHFFSRVPGRFKVFDGVIELDESDLTKGSVNFNIEAASIDTNEAKRDQHLRSDAFFEVEKHPKITFKSRRIRAAGDNALEVDGDLTIRGVTKAVTLDVAVLGFGELYSVRRAAFEAKTKINRQDFNVSWNDVVEGGGAVLGNEVDIVINLQAKLQPQTTAQN